MTNFYNNNNYCCNYNYYNNNYYYYFYFSYINDTEGGLSPMNGQTPQLSSLMKSREPKEFKFTSVNFTVDNGM